MPGIAKIFCLTAQVEQIVADLSNVINDLIANSKVHLVRSQVDSEAPMLSGSTLTAAILHPTQINPDIPTHSKLIRPIARGKDWLRCYFRRAYIRRACIRGLIFVGKARQPTTSTICRSLIQREKEWSFDNNEATDRVISQGYKFLSI